MSQPKHELNTDFVWRRREGSAPRRLSRRQIDSYHAEGFLVIEDVFDAETLRQVTAEIDPWEEKVTRFLQTQEDGRFFIARADEITFTTHLVARSQHLREFCASMPFQELAHDLIGPDVRLYWDQAVYKKPGTAAPFPWHQDNGYTYVEPQQYLTCWVALTGATVDNGCPWVVPGLHTEGTLAHTMTDLGWNCFDGEPPGKVAAPVRAGGIVVFSSLTPHATGPNTTDQTRKSYIVQFAPDGAVVREKGKDSDVWQRVAADASDRQFHVLRDGEAPGA